MKNSPQAMLERFSADFSCFVNTAYTDKSSSLHDSIKYCLSGEGKKIRATIAMLVCDSYGVPYQRAFAAAAAVEFLHAYSLVHDDLPCMDDDDFRRGRPSLHKAFDEATALLAGDAILTDAFRILSDDMFSGFLSDMPPAERLRMIRELSRAAGKMVLGQALDMRWTGQGGYKAKDLNEVHAGKTGALVGACAAMGAISAGASEEDAAAWTDFGVRIGIAFQAIDDTIDKSQNTGKSAGKDTRQGKLTYLAMHSVEETIDLAMSLTDGALSKIPQHCDADRLSQFVRALVFRQK